eukprot:g13431.t2
MKVKTLSPSSRETLQNRCCAPQTVLEKRVASVCSRLPEVRPAHEVKWLASHLRRMPTLQHIPAWKLEGLGRNMTAAFAREGDNACLLCTDPAFSYFLVSGSLMPIKATGVHATPSLLTSAQLSSSHGAPTVEVASVTESRVGGKTSTRTHSPKETEAREHLRPVACEVETPPGLAFGAWTYPYDTNSIISGSALTPVQGKNGGENTYDGSDLGSAVSKSPFSVPMATSAKASASPSASDVRTAPTSARNESAGVGQVEGCSLLPGQSLDSHLLHKLVSAVEEAGPDGGDYDEAGRPEVVPALPEGFNGDTTDPRRWRLEAQGRVCVGRVSFRFLKELEREESKHDVEMKVAFLRRTEVFGHGFSLAILQRLAVLMERQEQAEASVVRRKGDVVDKVVMIESGEAIRLGDPQEDSMKAHSSLRVRTGQMFGAEEVLSGIPVYTGNLMTVTPIRFFAIPTAVFLQATRGVRTKPLYRLRCRARVMGHGCSARSRGQQQRPSTATGVGIERSDSQNWSRMKTLAACWTPWSCSGDDDDQPSQDQKRLHQQEEPDSGEMEGHEQTSPLSRPKSAPAPTTKTPATTQPYQAPPPQGGGEIDNGITSGSPHKASMNSRSTGDLRRKRTDDLAGAPGAAANRFAAAATGGGAEERGLFGEQASPASPDFRRLGPSHFRSMPLAGSDFNAIPAESLGGLLPAVAVDSGGVGGREFHPETLVPHQRSSSGSTGTHNPRHDQRTKTNMTKKTKRKPRKRPAMIRPATATAPATDPGGRGAVEDKDGGGWLNPPPGERSPLLLGGRNGSSNGMQVVKGGVDDAGGDVSDSASGLTWKGIGRAPLSLSTRSSSPQGSASTSLAATLELGTKREIAAAKRALSCRPQRARLCRALRTHASTSAGMAAAQRSLRGAFVMSKMGNAKERSTWRPSEWYETALIQVV